MISRGGTSRSVDYKLHYWEFGQLFKDGLQRITLKSWYRKWFRAAGRPATWITNCTIGNLANYSKTVYKELLLNHDIEEV
jgi:hypothetical protein